MSVLSGTRTKVLAHGKRVSSVVVGAWLVATAIGCGDARVCAPGDQYRCMCSDGTYGYRRCNAAGDDFARCECTIGLGPDAGSPTHDAGDADVVSAADVGEP
jgi:hypothetical protein